MLTKETESTEILSRQTSDMVALVTGVGTVEVLQNPETKPEGCGVCQVNSEVSCYVELKGLIDVATELKKKDKKIKQLEGAVKKYENVIAKGAGKMAEDVLAKKQAQLDSYKLELQRELDQKDALKAME